MKKIILLLGIACLLIFIGCGQEEKNEQPPRDEITQPVERKQETTSEAAEATKKEIKETVDDMTAGDREIETAGASGVIKMKNEKAFQQHRMGIVQFDHEKHFADKPEGYGLGCGECHHDENGMPLTELRAGDSVQDCFECHDKAGRPQRDSSMSPEEWEQEQLKYYYGAIHNNCMDCHKEMGGPKTCTECHPRPDR